MNAIPRRSAALMLLATLALAPGAAEIAAADGQRSALADDDGAA
jgi:hypothetical protein